MKIVTNGDFAFPLYAYTYLQDQFYAWSHGSGAPNLDQIIRFWVRLPNLLIFMLTGSNLAVSYFYILFVGSITLASFYYFCRYFLQIQERWPCLVLSLFYAINPVFLGNYSKLGLVLAATMLPFLLSFLKQFYLTRRFSFLLLAIFALNISFIHPFNLIVNTGVCIGYVAFLIIKDRTFLTGAYRKVLLASICVVLINAYIISTVASVGTVSKSALSENIGNQSGASASLVELANTGNIFTAFTLSKNVFLDYNFYSPSSKGLFYISSFSIYIILVAMVIYIGDKAAWARKAQLITSLTAILALLLLSTGTFLGVNKLIMLIISLPGGWAFRSPLKWQFYLPISLCTLLLILIIQLPARLRRTALILTTCLTLCMNGYLLLDIGYRLLLPKDISHLQVLADAAPTRGKILLVKDSVCVGYMQNDGSLLNELRAVYRSKSTQVKETSAEDLDTINISTYDQLLSCKPLPRVTVGNFSFETQPIVRAGAFTFYRYSNTRPKGQVYATSLVSVEDTLQHAVGKYAFLRKRMPGTFDFVTAEQPATGGLHATDIFNSIAHRDITGKSITKTLRIKRDNNTKTVFDTDSTKTLYYKYDPKEQKLAIAATAKPGFQAHKKNSVTLPTGKDTITVTYEDPSYSFQNLVRNHSLESGLWKQKVGDCFAYDSSPQISMKLNTQEKTDGNKSLELGAGSHMACTGPDDIAINPANSDYLISFNYKTSPGSPARYNLAYDDTDDTSATKSLPASTTWAKEEATIKPPPGATHMKLTLYGIPSLYGQTKTLYDNFQITEIPKLPSVFFILGQSSEQATTNAHVTSRYDNPTKIHISVKHASKHMQLVLNESFHKRWQLFLKTPAGASPQPIASRYITHYRLNDQENAWQIDVAGLCDASKRCNKAADGSYSMELVAQFTPQQSFIRGLLVSVASVAAATAYIIGENMLLFTRRHRYHHKRRT